jgi:hypothetical protein
LTVQWTLSEYESTTQTSRHGQHLIYPTIPRKIASLSARLVEPNRNRDNEDDDDEALFAELEAEIENEGDSMAREQGLGAIKRE